MTRPLTKCEHVAYGLGMCAYLDGEPVTSNPFSIPDELRWATQWHKGWNETKGDMTNCKWCKS